MASSLSSFDLASLLKYEFRGVELIVQPHSHILVYVQFSKSNVFVGCSTATFII